MENNLKYTEGIFLLKKKGWLIIYFFIFLILIINNYFIFYREKFRGSEHFFWDYILNTRKANALRIDHKKIPKRSVFSIFLRIIQLKSKPENHPHIINI